MPDKSFVTMEQHVCDVCGQPFNTGALLLDKWMRSQFERTTITGWGLCPEHQAKYDEGFIALVGVDPSKSGQRGETLKREDAYHTGKVAHVRGEAWPNIFNTALPTDAEGKMLPVVFADDQVIDLLSSQAA